MYTLVLGLITAKYCVVNTPVEGVYGRTEVIICQLDASSKADTKTQ